MTPLDPGFKQLTPEGKITFAIVANDGIEVMYQTRASVLAEDPSAAKDLDGHSIVKPRHDTFYGSTEISVLEPGGNTVGFAQMKSPAQ